MQSMIEFDLTHLPIAIITLNRPDVHNAFNDALISEWLNLLQQIEQDDRIRVIILQAKGKSFCAGADVQWMQRMVNYSLAQNLHDAQQLAQLMEKLYRCTQPIIAVIQGAAYGGGVGIVACCDIVIAASSAQFCFSEVKLGLIPAVISPYVIAAIGARNAKRYFITAETFDAKQALAMNLIHELITDETALSARAFTLAQTILHNGPQAVKAAKKLVNDVASRTITQELQQELAQLIAEMRISPEGQAGLNAFLTKQTAPWLADKDS